MAEVDESLRQRYAYHELPFDRERRERRRGRGPAVIIMVLMVAIGSLAYWLAHR